MKGHFIFQGDLTWLRAWVVWERSLRIATLYCAVLPPAEGVNSPWKVLALRGFQSAHSPSPLATVS